jgi:hypothetical protein
MLPLPLTLIACATEELPTAASRSDLTLRIDVATTPAVAVPDCTLLLACPQDGVDPASCLDDPSLFTVTMLGEAVSSIDLDPDAVVPSGHWVAPFPDASGGCDLTLFSFRGRG